MIKYFSNRELADLFSVNLAKWKRWSREFLPPDPLGGYRSGYARQYSLSDAWTVFLGGHLVAGLKFTIPEARRIMADLHPWFKQAGLLFDVGSAPNIQPLPGIDEVQIAIYQETDASVDIKDFKYVIRGYLSMASSAVKTPPPLQRRFLRVEIVPKWR